MLSTYSFYFWYYVLFEIDPALLHTCKPYFALVIQKTVRSFLSTLVFGLFDILFFATLSGLPLRDLPPIRGFVSPKMDKISSLFLSDITTLALLLRYLGGQCGKLSCAFSLKHVALFLPSKEDGRSAIPDLC